MLVYSGVVRGPQGDSEAALKSVRSSLVVFGEGSGKVLTIFYLNDGAAPSLKKKWMAVFSLKECQDCLKQADRLKFISKQGQVLLTHSVTDSDLTREFIRSPLLVEDLRFGDSLLLEISGKPQQEIQVYATSVNNARSKQRYLTEYVPTAPSENPEIQKQQSSKLLIVVILLLLVVTLLFVFYLFHKLKIGFKEEVINSEEDPNQRSYQFQEVPRFDPATGLSM